MKIPLISRKGKLEIGNGLLIVGKRNTIVADFILDTGSPETIIPYEQAVRLQVDFKNLTKNEGMTRLIGGKFYSYNYSKIKFVFAQDNKEQHKEEFTKEFPVTILKPTSKKNKDKVESMDIPIIIGLDFLLEKNYTLYCDINKKETYLEKKI